MAYAWPTVGVTRKNRINISFFSLLLWLQWVYRQKYIDVGGLLKHMFWNSIVRDSAFLSFSFMVLNFFQKGNSRATSACTRPQRWATCVSIFGPRMRVSAIPATSATIEPRATTTWSGTRMPSIQPRRHFRQPIPAEESLPQPIAARQQIITHSVTIYFHDWAARLFPSVESAPSPNAAVIFPTRIVCVLYRRRQRAGAWVCNMRAVLASSRRQIIWRFSLMSWRVMQSALLLALSARFSPRTRPVWTRT